MAARDCPGRKRRSAFSRDHPDSDGLVTCTALTPHFTAMTPDDYDKLSPEEREAKDKNDREREHQEQGGAHDHIYCCDYRLSRTSTSPPL